MKKKAEKPAKGSKTKSGEIVDVEEKFKITKHLKVADVAVKVEWLTKSSSTPLNTIGILLYKHFKRKNKHSTQ